MIALPHSTKEQARLAYLAGERVTQIAQDLGLQRSTVAQWASRGRWKEERKAIVTRTREAVGMTAEDVTNCHISRHQEQVYRVTEGNLDALANFQPKEAQEFVQVGQALKHLSDVARRNLGMDADGNSVGPRPTFNFNLGSVKAVKKCGLSPAQPSAIEIESKAV